MQVNSGGCVELHSAVLAPLSPLFLPYPPPLTMVLLPDYRAEVVQSLADLLYTGRCLSKDPHTDLTEIVSLGQSLGISSLNRENLSLYVRNYQHKKFGSTDVSPTKSDCDVSNQPSISPEPVKKVKCRRRQQPDLSCPVCGDIVEGGKFKLRYHLVDKHFYKRLSVLLGRNTKNCPLCDKQVSGRSNLIKHYGTKHGVVDKLLEEMNIDPENNELLNTSSSFNIEDQSTVISDASIHGVGYVDSPSKEDERFECILCPSNRKNRFRLLQHYCVAHFKDRLLEDYNPMFLDNNGQCGLCRKLFRDQILFTVHMGAAHQKVLEYLRVPQSTKKTSKPPVHCYFPSCSESLFPNNSSLMRHLSAKHFRNTLVNLLKPKFDSDNKCDQCGKEFTSFHNYLTHCAITHRLVINLYMNFLRAKKEAEPSLRYLDTSGQDQSLQDQAESSLDGGQETFE